MCYLLTLSDCYGPQIRPRLCTYRANTLLVSSTPAKPFYFWKKVIIYIWGGAYHGTHRAVSSLHPYVGPGDQTRVGRFGGKYTYPMSYLTASPNFISSERRGYKQWVPDLTQKELSNKTQRVISMLPTVTQSCINPHNFLPTVISGSKTTLTYPLSRGLLFVSTLQFAVLHKPPSQKVWSHWTHRAATARMNDAWCSHISELSGWWQLQLCTESSVTKLNISSPATL